MANMTDTSRLQVEIPEPLHRCVKAVAGATGLTQAEVVERALESWIWRHHPALAGALIHTPGEDEA